MKPFRRSFQKGEWKRFQIFSNCPLLFIQTQLDLRLHDQAHLHGGTAFRL